MSVRDLVEEPFLSRSSSVLVLFVLVLMGTSCAIRHVDFWPRERIDGESAGGYPTASYELVGEDHGGASELHLWSAGATRGEQNHTLRIGFEIENRFDDPCALDLEATRIVELELDGTGVLDQAELKRPTVLGTRAVEAGRTATIELVYTLPAGVEPGDLRSFAVEWTVATPEVFEQRTPFRRAWNVRRPSRYGGWYSSAGFFPFYFYRSSGFGFHRRYSGRYCPPGYSR